jgi:hypothetical protein
MGVTIICALAFWAAGSYIEYRVIKALPWTKAIFDHGLGGIILSITIGILVSWAMGPAAGVGAGLGQLLGLATNKITYETYASGARILETSKGHYRTASDFMDRNRKHLTMARNTLTYGAQVLGVIFLIFMFIIGLPARLVNWCIKVRNHGFSGSFSSAS